MARITAAQVFADLRVAAAPETREIARDLYRALRRRQQLEGYRYRATTDARGRIEPENFLQFDGDAGSVRVQIVDADPGAARNCQLARRQRLELTQLRAAEPRAQRIGQRNA